MKTLISNLILNMKTKSMKTIFTKNFVLSIGLLMLNFLFGLTVTAQSSGDYRSKASGNWSAPATWETYDGTSWINAVSAPSSASGVITIISPNVVTVSTTVTVDQVTVNAGAQITVNTTGTLNIANGTGIDLIVSGTISNAGTIAPTGTIGFNAGSTFTHNQNGSTIPVSTWASTSTCNITGVTGNLPSGATQNFGNLTWNCSGQTNNVFPLTINIQGDLNIMNTGGQEFRPTDGSTHVVGGNYNHTGGIVRWTRDAAGSLTVNGNVTISGGECRLTNGAGIGTLNILGNLEVSSSGILTETGTVAGNVVFKKTGTQTFTSGGTISNIINFTVNSGSTLQMASTSTIVSGNAFTLSSGASLGITSADGITTTGATGNIQTTTRTYTTGASYIYNGTVAQNTGNGIAQNTPANITVNNTSAAVTLNSNPTISGNITVNAGTIFDIASANITLGSSSIFTLTGTLSFSNTTGFVRTGNNVNATLTAGASSLIKTVDEIGLGPVANASIQNQGTGVWTVSSLSTNGTVEYNAAVAQAITDRDYNNITVSSTGTKTWTLAATRAVNNFTVNGSTTLAGAQNLNLTGVLNPLSGTLTLNSNITLKSTATQTAQVAAVAGTISYGTGKFIIERYMQARRAWRFLAAPVTAASAPSINAAWQEGVTTASVTPNPNPGYGTHITGGNNTGLGFDQNPSGSFSTKQSTVSNVWDNISNTATAKVTDQKGYMVFVRGSRANVLSQGTGAVADATTLRVSGQLNVGDQTFTNSAAGYFPISNPYASAINMPTVWGTGNNITMTYSVWDPFLTGSNSVGAFVQYSWNGFSWTKSVTPVSALVDGKVESGSAIIVQWMGANTLTLTESNKTSGSVLSQTPTTAPTEESRITLNRVNGDGTVSTQDGMVVTYDAAYSNGLDMWDAEKLNNFSQNISSNRNGSKIAIERRALIANHDTTFINIDQIGAGNYQFEIANTELNHPGLIGQLKDNYLNTLTNLDLNGTTTIAFSIDGNAASYAVNRFAIYFGIAGPLPVNYSSVKAYRRSNDIAVEWKVENEISIKQYQVERAADGTNFSKIATVLPTGNANSSAQYLAADISPLSGDNFYRVKAISLSGRIQYSPVVRVVAPKTTQEISVYPNPVTSNTINIRYSQQTAGTYQARLYTIDGILLYNGSIQLSSNGVEAIILGAKPAAGSYQLEIKNANETILTQKVIVQ